MSDVIDDLINSMSDIHIINNDEYQKLISLKKYINEYLTSNSHTNNTTEQNIKNECHVKLRQYLKIVVTCINHWSLNGISMTKIEQTPEYIIYESLENLIRKEPFLRNTEFLREVYILINFMIYVIDNRDDYVYL